MFSLRYSSWWATAASAEPIFLPFKMGCCGFINFGRAPRPSLLPALQTFVGTSVVPFPVMFKWELASSGSTWPTHLKSDKCKKLKKMSI